MASMTVRNLDDTLAARLRSRAATHGRSVEEEAREILRDALSEAEQPAGNLAEAIRTRVGPLGGVTLDLPSRQGMRHPGDP